MEVDHLSSKLINTEDLIYELHALEKQSFRIFACRFSMNKLINCSQSVGHSASKSVRECVSPSITIFLRITLY